MNCRNMTWTGSSAETGSYPARFTSLKPRKADRVPAFDWAGARCPGSGASKKDRMGPDWIGRERKGGDRKGLDWSQRPQPSRPHLSPHLLGGTINSNCCHSLSYGNQNFRLRCAYLRRPVWTKPLKTRITEN